MGHDQPVFSDHCVGCGKALTVIIKELRIENKTLENKIKKGGGMFVKIIKGFAGIICYCSLIAAAALVAGVVVKVIFG
jgi:hypothetical protein